MIISKEILGLCAIASNDKSRPAICAIKFEDHKAIATDGYALMEVLIPIYQTDNAPEIDGKKLIEIKEALLSAEDVAQFAKQIKKGNFLPILNTGWAVEEKDNSITLATTDLDVHVQMELRKVSEEFPKYQKVLDDAKGRKEAHKIAFNPKKMIDLLQGMIKAGVNGDYAVVLSFEGPTGSILLEDASTDKRVTGLLMPVRLPELDEVEKI